MNLQAKVTTTIVALVLVATARASTAGPHWMRIYTKLGPSGGDSVRALLPTPGGGAIVHVSSGSYGPGSSSFWLMEIDADGDASWHAATGTPSQDNPHGLAVLADGRIAFAGNCLSLTAGVVGILAADGTPDRLLLFDGATTVEDRHDVVPLSDGGMVVVGSSQSSGVYRACAVRLASDGSVVAAVHLGAGFFESARKAAAGGLLAVGRLSQEGLAVRFDDDLGVTWSRRLSPGTYASALAARPDGGWVMAGYDSANGWVTALSPAGDTEWETIIEQPPAGSSWDVFDDVDVAPDGSIYACGTTTSGLSTIVKLTPEGRVAWQKHLTYPSPISIFAIRVLGDGDLLVAGGLLGVDHAEAWIARLDPDGDLCSDCPITIPGTFLVTEIPGRPGVDAGLVARTLDVPATDPGWPWTVPVPDLVTVCPTSGSVPPEVSPPGSAQPLRFLDRSMLAWEEDCAFASFDVFRGDIAGLRARDYGTCLLSAHVGASAVDAEVPGVGTPWFYLVAGRNAAGAGTAGFDSLGGERLPTPCP